MDESNQSLVKESLISKDLGMYKSQDLIEYSVDSDITLDVKESDLNTIWIKWLLLRVNSLLIILIINMEKSKNTTSSIKILFFCLIGIALKHQLSSSLQYLKHYAHFNTTLNDVKTMKEEFSNNEITGNYFIDPNAISLPLLVVKTFHIIFKLSGDFGIHLSLMLIDFIVLMLQITLIRKVLGNKIS